MMNLLKHHPSYEEKVGSGIKSIVIKLHPSNQKRYFCAYRTDGSETDFSFHKCIEPRGRRAELYDLYSAARHSVQWIDKSFRQNFFKRYKEGSIMVTNDVLRRLGKRLFVNQLDSESRRSLFENYIENKRQNDEKFRKSSNSRVGKRKNAVKISEIPISVPDIAGAFGMTERQFKDLPSRIPLNHIINWEQMTEQLISRLHFVFYNRPEEARVKLNPKFQMHFSYIVSNWLKANEFMPSDVEIGGYGDNQMGKRMVDQKYKISFRHFYISKLIVLPDLVHLLYMLVTRKDSQLQISEILLRESEENRAAKEKEASMATVSIDEDSDHNDFSNENSGETEFSNTDHNLSDDSSASLSNDKGENEDEDESVVEIEVEEYK